MNKALMLLTSLLFAATLWLAGCARSPSARFYTLTPVVQPQQATLQRPSKVSISIAPVEIPDYLNRPEIVTRIDGNELKISEYHRWGGSLSDNISGVLAENLALLTGSERVVVQPLPGGEKADYVVALRVVRLDCIPGNQVLLKAQWTVFDALGKRALATHLMTFSETLQNNNYETMVAAVSQVFEKLSREIAQEIMDRRN